MPGNQHDEREVALDVFKEQADGGHLKALLSVPLDAIADGDIDVREALLGCLSDGFQIGFNKGFQKATGNAGG